MQTLNQLSADETSALVASVRESLESSMISESSAAAQGEEFPRMWRIISEE